jgi:hypothetical protein
MKNLLLVFSEPAPGGEDEYNEWYTQTHLGEVVATPGFVAAQRFRFVSTNGEEPSQGYIAIYEVDGDIDAAKAALAEGRRHRVPVPDAMAAKRTSWWFTSISERVVDASDR